MPQLRPLNVEGDPTGVATCVAIPERAIAGHADVSVEAVQLKVIDVWPTALVASPVGVRRRCYVRAGWRSTASSSPYAETLPAASTAATPRV